MNENQSRPTAKELTELTAYLTAHQDGLQPAPGKAGFPSGLAGELLMLAEGSEPDPAFAARLELQLRQAAEAGGKDSRPGWPSALWQSFILPERKTTMKRLAAFALVGIALFAILWVSLPALFPSPTQTQLVLATPPTHTPVSTPLSPITPTVVPPTSQPPVAINFTPQPIPAQPPTLPSLVEVKSVGFGGSGGGNLPHGLPLSLSTELPEGPSEVTAYYRLENTPLTHEEASQIAIQWGLDAKLYLPAWMQSITPDEAERSYYAIDEMQNLFMLNDELSYTDLAIFPIFGGHQFPQTGLLPSEQAIATATQYLTERGFLNFPYQVDLRDYNYGLVNFYQLIDNLLIDNLVASVKIDPQGQVGYAWNSREDYQSVGTYPVESAQSAWDILLAGQPSDQLSISYYPAQDGNPQYWGREYPSGHNAELFGVPTYYPAAEIDETPYLQLNNLMVVGDVSSLIEYLQENQSYIHAWGEVQEVEGTHQLELTGWESIDEFSVYFDGTIRRTTEGDFLELGDGQQVSLPDLPADVPGDIPLFVEGGLVGDTLEWYLLQVHPADEGQLPPDLSLVQAVIDKVELVYLAPDLSYLPPEMRLDPSNRMLLPAWSFSGYLTNAGDTDYMFQAYVQAVSNP